jgi:hypothetical protein
MNRLNELNNYAVGFCDLEESLALGFSLDRRRNRHALGFQSGVFVIDIIHYKR